MNLFEKMQAVSISISHVEKNIKIGSGSFAYKAVSEVDVLTQVKKAEAENRVMSIPIKQELLKSEVITVVNSQGKESISHVDTIKMTVRIIDLDAPESFIDVESLGKGIDPQDKGLGKASTYARKYALLNAYKLITGEDPDQHGSEEVSRQRKSADPLVDADDVHALVQTGIDPSKAREVLMRFGYDGAKTVRKKDFHAVLSAFKEAVHD
jgi:hypothetical protein